MATELKNSEKIRTATRELVETKSCAGLTSDPDFLLAILNSIEQSVAAGFRPQKSTRRVRVLFH